MTRAGEVRIRGKPGGSRLVAVLANVIQVVITQLINDSIKESSGMFLFCCPGEAVTNHIACSPKDVQRSNFVAKQRVLELSYQIILI